MSVAWVVADRGKTAKVEEGVDGLGAAGLDCLFLQFSAVWSLRGQPRVEHTPGDHPPLSEDFGLAHCFPLWLFLCLTREDGADEPVALCSCLLLGCS